MSFSISPALAMARRMAAAPVPDVTDRASERWEVAPGTEVRVRPARCLPGQMERIRAAAFGSVTEVLQDLRGGFSTMQPPTVGYRLRGVDLVDGVLYCRGAERHLRKRSRRSLGYRTPVDAMGGALYESWRGNRWFGNWLADDCLTYRLAKRFGHPVTTGNPTGHAARYEALLGQTPMRVENVRFEELLLFDDVGHCAEKRERADANRRRLVGAGAPESHAGVFLLRKANGDRRFLANEMEIAERLARRRGFRIVDPLANSADAIVAQCAGAQVVVGVEGSHLVHGLVAMPPGSTLLALQPPARAVSVLKMITDRQEQEFAFVVGQGGDADFVIDPEEVERTLDLL